MWEFGNGRTEEGCEVSHTFGFNGVYEANLIVRLPSGRQETTNFEVVIGDVESFVEPAGVFGTGNEPGSDTVPAGNADDPAQDPPSDNETNADPVDNTDPRDQAPDDIDDQTQPDFETDDNPVDDETPDEEPVDVEILSVDAGDDVVVFSGRPVALDGLVTYTSMSGMPAISWQQRGGPPVVWPESRYASDARLIVPMVSQVAEIELALVATADDQAGGTQIVEDTLRITVEPIPASLELDDPRWADQLSDDTTSLQQALDSGASTITVPATGLRTVYETLLVRDDTTLILEPGVVIHAAPDEFHGIFDSLMEVHEVRNVTIHGNGATMRMRREDYDSTDYQQSEWRHTLSIQGAENIEVVGLKAAGSGGDGIYVGATWDDRRVPCRNVTLRGCHAEDNYRNGIGIVSVENLLVEDCLITGTSGTAPQAGLLIEPSDLGDRLINILVRNCRVESNSGTGFMTNLSRLKGRSEPVDVAIEDCLVDGTIQPGLRAIMREDLGATGHFTFRRITVKNVRHAGAKVIWDQRSDTSVSFEECTFEHVAFEDGLAPFAFEMTTVGQVGTGTISFSDCHLFNDRQRSTVSVLADGTELFPNVSGEITISDVDPGETDHSRLPNLNVVLLDNN